MDEAPGGAQTGTGADLRCGAWWLWPPLAVALLGIAKWLELRYSRITLDSNNALPAWLYLGALLAFVVIALPAIRQARTALEGAGATRIGWPQMKCIVRVFSLTLLISAVVLICQHIPYDAQDSLQIRVRAQNIADIRQGGSARFWRLTTDSWRGRPSERFSAQQPNLINVKTGDLVPIRLATDVFGRRRVLAIVSE
ncbi:hypothetical protein G3480_06425 [Thiorhodococcus mannitoliphagus]|uniref:DUF4131 domain-containing protein n=1 Tax=Thiorhodococcus mannitoliphagus TaxID=329406 RepID=A0A6P1DQY5_9GAMM|nr:hypothetical protein [Thiorhodococcus mannitoliphagus]NEX19950.1 hypothetical protein [Thiorhodococcus mannitoliphagus]